MKNYTIIAYKIANLCQKYGKNAVYREWFEDGMDIVGLENSIELLVKNNGYFAVSEVMCELFLETDIGANFKRKWTKILKIIKDLQTLNL